MKSSVNEKYCFVTLALYLLSVSLASCTSDYHFTLLYEDVRGLEKKSALVYKEIRIGSVDNITLRTRPSGLGGMFYVDVSVNAQYTGMLNHQMSYRIRRAPDSDKMVIEISDARRVNQLRPVRPGDYVMGYQGLWEEMNRQAQSMIEDINDALEGAGTRIPELLNELQRLYEENVDQETIDALIEELKETTANASADVRDWVNEVLAMIQSR